ncbi:MAG: hypothetical protein HQK83_07455 [Fibrobacteria bacterium]|nr:hypothetical protein [Fibrobacteria bacterium]
MQVAAEVEMGKTEGDLIAQQLLYEIKNKPRLMILLDERSEGKEMFEKTATHKFEEYLLEKGYKIVEPEQFKKIQEVEKAKGLDDKDLASLAFRHGADLIIRGGVSAGKPTPKTIYGKQFYTVPVQLNAHIVKADNAEIIASKTKRVKKNSQEEFSAAQFGLEVGGSALAQELIKNLQSYWRSEAYNQGSVELYVTGLGDQGIARTQEMLKKVAFIKGVQLRYLEKKSALFDLQIKGTVQDVRELFNKSPEFNLKVSHMTSNRIGVKAGKGAAEKILFEYQGPGLDIENFSVKEIFPSRVRYYEQNPLSTVSIASVASAPLQDIQVSVHIPALMDLPAQASLKSLDPGGKDELKLNLILNSEKVLNNTETKSFNSQVTLTYLQNGKRKKRQLTAPVQVFDRNTMDWKEPYALAAFVTYREPSVNKFARNAIPQSKKEWYMNTELSNGMAIFQALHKHGIKYIKDPAGSPGNRVLDRVQYPRETMELKSGDCDDSAVLYAAMLTAVGIKTAIVSYPDHVLVMFDTGIFDKNRMALGDERERMVSHKGTLWVPVETTLINKGFLTAWTTAAEEFNQAISEGQRVSVIELSEAWKTYAAVSLKNPPKEWKIDELKQAVELERKKVDEAISGSWQQAAKDLEAKKSMSAADLNRLGMLYARMRNYPKAEKVFEKLTKKDKSPKAMSNYACAIILTGDEKKALNVLEKAFKKEKDAGIAINRALSFYLKAQGDNDMDSFVNALKEANELLPEGTNLGKYLGFSVEDEGEETRASGDHEKASPKKLDRRRLRELIRQRVLTDKLKTAHASEKKDGKKLMHFGGVRGADPEQVAQIVDLLFWYELN